MVVVVVDVAFPHFIPSLLLVPFVVFILVIMVALREAVISITVITIVIVSVAVLVITIAMAAFLALFVPSNYGFDSDRFPVLSSLSTIAIIYKVDSAEIMDVIVSSVVIAESTEIHSLQCTVKKNTIAKYTITN